MPKIRFYYSRLYVSVTRAALAESSVTADAHCVAVNILPTVYKEDFFFLHWTSIFLAVSYVFNPDFNPCEGAASARLQTVSHFELFSGGRRQARTISILRGDIGGVTDKRLL